MYTQLASKLAVSNSTPEYSPAVGMAGSNAFQVELTVYAFTGSASEVTIDTQGSNDLQNWTTFGSAYTVNAVGYSAPSARTAVAFQFVRLKYQTTTGAGYTILAGGLNTADL